MIMMLVMMLMSSTIWSTTLAIIMAAAAVLVTEEEEEEQPPVIDALQPAKPSLGWLRYAIALTRRRQMSSTSSVIFRVASETSIVLGTAIPSTALRSR